MRFDRKTRTLVVGIVWSGIGLAGLGGAGCASAARAVGMAKVVPDEFRVVSKAPLVVPPDYSLRPPEPGVPRPQELQPDSLARAALIGQTSAAGRSQGETLLATKAGAGRADPLIRFVVDDESSGVAHKDKSFADRVMFWRSGEARTAAEPGANTPAPVDAASEEASVRALTGGQTVVFSRGGGGGLKLPGL